MNDLPLTTAGGLWAVFAGVSFGVTAVVFKMGSSRGLTPVQIVSISACFGAVIFGGMTITAPMEKVPAVVWLPALTAGVTQYLMLLVLRSALRLGPMSAMWCAVSLLFVPVILYSRIALHKSLTLLQIAGVCAAAACVITASAANRRSRADSFRTAGMTGGRGLLYLVVLVTLMLLNGVSGIVQYDLSQRSVDEGMTLLVKHGSCYYFVFYLGIAGVCLLDLAVRGKLLSGLRAAWVFGIIAGACSSLGMYSLGTASALSGSVAFAVCGAAGILWTAIVGAAFFHEQRTFAWYATIALGVVAVIVGNLGAG